MWPYHGLQIYGLQLAHTYLSLVLTPSALEGVSVEVGYTDESTQVTDMDLVFI